MTHLDQLWQKHYDITTQMVCTNDEEGYLLLSAQQWQIEKQIAREEIKLANEYASHSHYPKPILFVLAGLVTTLLLLFVFGNHS